jgi:hypothetical protein
MRVRSSAKLCLALLSLAAMPAYAQTNPPGADIEAADAITSSLAEIVSLATLGTVTSQQRAAQVTRSGADYLVRLPLRGFLAPPNAAVDAVARPLDGGMWDIESMAFPLSGTVVSTMPNADPGRITYSVGEQAWHGRVDPSFARQSSFAAKLSDVRIRSDLADHRSEQSFERCTLDGSMIADPAGTLSLASRGEATNWRLTAHAAGGPGTDALVRKLAGHFSVEGLDRAKGTRVLAAARALMADAPAATPGQVLAPGQAPDITPVQREELRALVDAASGLLTRFQAEETMDDIRLTVGPGKSGSIGRMRLNVAGGVLDERLNARLDLAIDEFAMAALSPDVAAYVPHHVDLKSALSGVRTGPLMALLRDATEPNADPAALQARFMALFGEADAHIGIESLTFDSGPVRVTGSARIVPRADGKPGADIHLSATGIDTLIAQAQGKPALQQALPIMFIAKGMGRPEGGATVWDITFGDGPMKVNGVAFGQPAARKR